MKIKRHPLKIQVCKSRIFTKILTKKQVLRIKLCLYIIKNISLETLNALDLMNWESGL